MVSLKNKVFLSAVVFLCAFFMFMSHGIAQGQSANHIKNVPLSTNASPVVPFNDTLFYIYDNLGTFTSAQRAQSIEECIKELSDLFQYKKDSILLVQSFNGYINLVYQDDIIMSVDSVQALRQTTSMNELALFYKKSIEEAIDKDHRENSMTRLFVQIMSIVAIFVGVFYLLKFIKYIFRRLNKYILAQEGKKVKELFGFIEAEKQIAFYLFLVKILRGFLVIVILYLGLMLLFNLFPATRDLSSTLLGYVIAPIKSVGKGFVLFLPNLIKIIIIIIFFRIIIKLLRAFTEKIADGSIHFKSFYPEWAFTTFNIVRGLLFLLLFILIYNLIPNSDDPVFQGVSVFAGIIFSLGSTTIINNFISGFVITYMRSFKVGDRIKIGDTVGDVMEKTPLVVRLKTPKNEVITMPNSSLMAAQTINYTNSADQYGLILYLSVFVDIVKPWKEVHDLLLKVAFRTENLSKKQKPFILQEKIEDQVVEYQLNVYIKDASLMSKVYSDLRQNVQDVFKEADITLFTPIYYAKYKNEKDSEKKEEQQQDDSPL